MLSQRGMMTLMASIVVSVMNLFKYPDRAILQTRTSQKSVLQTHQVNVAKRFEDWKMSIENCTYDVRAYLAGCVDTKFINISVIPKTEYIQYNPSTGTIFYKPTKESIQCVIMVYAHEIHDLFLACNDIDPKAGKSEDHKSMHPFVTNATSSSNFKQLSLPLSVMIVARSCVNCVMRMIAEVFVS